MGKGKYCSTSASIISWAGSWFVENKAFTWVQFCDAGVHSAVHAEVQEHPPARAAGLAVAPSSASLCCGPGTAVTAPLDAD